MVNNNLVVQSNTQYGQHGTKTSQKDGNIKAKKSCWDGIIEKTYR